MLGSAVAYAAVMLGPWGALKMAAFDVGSTRWAAYAIGYLLLVGGVAPGLLWVAALGGRRLARSNIPMRPLVTSFARALVPLGLAAWIAFTVAFAFANLAYLWPVLSDPLARGWDLFGTADVTWTPYLTRLAPGLQACTVLGGLAWSSLEIRRAANRLTLPSAAARLALPVMGYGLVVSVALLRLLVA